MGFLTSRLADLLLFYFITQIYKNLNLMHLSFGKCQAGQPRRTFLHQYLLIQSFLSAAGVSEGLFPVSVPTQRFSLEALSRRPLAADHTQATADFSPEPHSANESKSIIKTQTLQMDKRPHGTQSFPAHKYSMAHITE